MNLSERFIRRPVMTVALTVSVILFGVLAYFRLPVSDLPAVDYPVIQVQVNYPGATPETMARWKSQGVVPDAYFCGAAPLIDGYPMNYSPQPARLGKCFGRVPNPRIR